MLATTTAMTISRQLSIDKTKIGIDLQGGSDSACAECSGKDITAGSVATGNAILLLLLLLLQIGQTAACGTLSSEH